jgi:hypothetical protein
MTRSQMVLWSVLAVLLAFAPAGSAWAASASQVPDPGQLLEANPKATGAKINGQLSVFYTLAPPSLACIPSPTVDMHIALQMWQKKITDSRTAGRLVRSQCYFSTSAQRTAIQQLIQDKLNPLFGFSTFQLKDAANLVQDENGQATDLDPWFLMMDFTLAAN